MSEDLMEHFDQVVQMQLAEFQRHILGATNADVVAILIETDGVVQCATGSTKYDEEKGRGKSSVLLCQVAAAMIKEGSGGQFVLQIRNLKTGEILDAGANTDSMVVKV